MSVSEVEICLLIQDNKRQGINDKINLKQRDIIINEDINTNVRREAAFIMAMPDRIVCLFPCVMPK